MTKKAKKTAAHKELWVVWMEEDVDSDFMDNAVICSSRKKAEEQAVDILGDYEPSSSRSVYIGSVRAIARVKNAGISWDEMN